MGDLSRNFSRKEFTCPCGCGSSDVEPLLVATLQRLRDAAGKPITINSGVRCKKHNAQVGGVADSQHLRGRAADIWMQDYTQEQLLSLIREMVRKDLIYVGYAYGIAGSSRAVHVDVRFPQTQTTAGWKAVSQT